LDNTIYRMSGIASECVDGHCDLKDKLIDEVTRIPQGSVIPPNQPVGLYSVTCECLIGGRSQTPIEVFVVFNPMLSGSSTHMGTEEELNEYLLKETGYVYMARYPKPWAYNQFSPEVLEAVWMLMVQQQFSSRDDPVDVSRFLSGMLNANGGSSYPYPYTGVLAGKWDGKYMDGTRPTSWSSSTEIFRQFVATKQTVRYGQCWVFGALLTTALRAIGIPARSVTNINSGHDTGVSRPFRVYDQGIDYYFTRDLQGNYNQEESLRTDSVWNFHVWTEAHMCRSDIPTPSGTDASAQTRASGCDRCGWQAVDATPQEISDEGDLGRYECGPSDVCELKKATGEPNAREYTRSSPFDSMFVIGEVAADIRYWIHRDVWKGLCPVGAQTHAEHVEYCLLMTKTGKVGTAMFTDSGGDRRDPTNIITTYKDQITTSNRHIRLPDSALIQSTSIDSTSIPFLDDLNARKPTKDHPSAVRVTMFTCVDVDDCSPLTSTSAPIDATQGVRLQLRSLYNDPVSVHLTITATAATYSRILGVKVAMEAHVVRLLPSEVAKLELFPSRDALDHALVNGADMVDYSAVFDVALERHSGTSNQPDEVPPRGEACGDEKAEEKSTGKAEEAGENSVETVTLQVGVVDSSILQLPPEVIVEANATPDSSVVTASFRNPLTVPLTQSHFTFDAETMVVCSGVECADETQDLRVEAGTILPGELSQVEVKVEAKDRSRDDIIVSFDSLELHGASGNANL